MIMQEQAIKRLEHLREVANKRRNQGRSQSSYRIGDYVLIHKSRWPQKKILKLESPWLGPFKICEVFHNSLQVLVSPSLGGLVKVSLSMVKKWCDTYDLLQPTHEDDAFDANDGNAHDEDEGAHLNNEVPSEEMTKDEMEAEGFYNVHAILKHKFHQGWRFLTHWEGYPLNASTWEPIRAFKLPDGRLNSKLVEYCEVHNLNEILKKALK